MNERLKEKLTTLPRTPGVYFHKSEDGEVIYVGKAAVLRNRVRQYFQSSRNFDPKTQALVREIADTDWIETESEVDALFLESEMVKRYMPRYNILLRDDKSQTYVRITLKEERPYVSFTRNPMDDGAEYIGPFYNGYAVKKALRYLRKVFPYYTSAQKKESRPGLSAQLGLEPHDKTAEEYKSELRQLISYIKGNRVAIVRQIEADMKAAATAHDFEKAALLRNRLNNLRELKRRIMFSDRESLMISKDKALDQLQTLLGIRTPLSCIEGYDISHMSGRDVVASQVVFKNGVSNRSEYKKYKLRVQQNDDYASMYEVISRRFSPKNSAAWGVPDLIIIDGGKGQLESAIRAMKERSVECAVISIAKREEEIIVDAERSNVTLHVDENGATLTREGNYCVVDLHPGQQNASGHSKNLRTAGTAVGMYDDVVKLFQRIRDESHRFAVSYHTTLKRTRQTKSSLEDIPGVGPATRRTLLKKFGSMRGAMNADLEPLKDAVGAAKARIIFDYFSSEKERT